MKKRLIALLLLVAVLAFSGCAMRTVEEMYSLPKRSEQYNRLQSAIDIAMVGLEYCAPISGENRQTLQKADLDGDGREEYLVFAKGTSERPLQLLIFRQEEDGKCTIMEGISFLGSAFEQVEYVDIDDSPGFEIVLGRQLSNQVMGNVSVYSFADGNARQLLGTAYSKFLCCNLDSDSKEEIMVIRPGESDSDNAISVLYDFKGDSMERSLEAQMSTKAESIKRITISKLHGGSPAVYVASVGTDNTVVTDVLAVCEDRFTNIAYSSGMGTGVDTLRNYYVYAEDIDGDSVYELPRLITMKQVSYRPNAEQQYLLRWYAVDEQGNEVDKLCTFHNYGEGWYLLLDNSWARKLTLEQRGNKYTFYMWDESFDRVTSLFTISVLTGTNREFQATEGNRFVLYRTATTTYAAKLESGSAMYGFTEEYLVNSFRLIQQDRQTGK